MQHLARRPLKVQIKNRFSWGGVPTIGVQPHEKFFSIFPTVSSENAAQCLPDRPTKRSVPILVLKEPSVDEIRVPGKWKIIEASEAVSPQLSNEMAAWLDSYYSKQLASYQSR